MPFCQCDDRPTRLRTRLETSLVRLHHTLRNRARHGEALDSMFTEWQSRWASRRDDIVQRLEAIDSQLDMWQPSNVGTPRLAVVGESEEARPETAARGEWTASTTND